MLRGVPNLGRKAALSKSVLSCPRCTGDFTPWRKDQKYCSSECRLKREPVVLICRRATCGIEFLSVHGNQAYCSGECRHQSWMELNKIKKDTRELRDQRVAGSAAWSTTVWWRLFRISEKKAREMVAEQGNRCASCRVEFVWGESKGKGNKSPVLDHCHTTGVGRGVICSRCNRLLGAAGDDAEVLRRAAEYLDSPPLSILSRSFVERGSDRTGLGNVFGVE